MVNQLKMQTELNFYSVLNIFLLVYIEETEKINTSVRCYIVVFAYVTKYMYIYTKWIGETLLSQYTKLYTMSNSLLSVVLSIVWIYSSVWLRQKGIRDTCQFAFNWLLLEVIIWHSFYLLCFFFILRWYYLLIESHF